MWQIISLFSLLVVAQAANINDIYGEWWEVAFYPVSTYVPLCVRFGFAENTGDVNCTYADGRNASVVLGVMMSESGELMAHHWMPMVVVNSAAEVMPALNVGVKCNGQDARERGVVRVVNEDYFIVYSPILPSMEYTRTDVEQNSAILFGKKVVSSEKLTAVMLSIEELRNRRGAQMCATENFGGFKSK